MQPVSTKALAEAQARLRKAEKELAPIEALRTEYDQAKAYLAELAARQAAVDKQIAHLRDERAPLVEWVAAVLAVLPKINAAIDGLRTMEDACTDSLNTIDFGMDAPLFRIPRYGLERVVESLAIKRERIAAFDAQIKALGGEL